MKNEYVYDLEQFVNFHCGVFYNINTKEIHSFVLHKNRNDLESYLTFLSNTDLLIGFNNLNYDYPLLHHLLETKNVSSLYTKSKEIINSKFSSIYKSKIKIPQLDLFKIWHFDNPAKRTSLKKLQFVLKWKKVQDLPLHPDSLIDSSQIDEIVKYCTNDVMSTNEFYLKSLEVINLRKKITEDYNIDVINEPDSSMGEKIFQVALCKQLNTSYKTLKTLKTYRSQINLGECILPYIKYRSNQFNKLLNTIKNKTITETKGVFNNLNVIYKGFKYDFGTGGMHGCIKPGIYSKSDTHIIIDADVKSFYPNLAIVNNIYPKHLGPAFCDIYKNLYETRKTFPKGTPQNYAIKISLNGAYGKSNSEHSFLYDPKYTMKITINGQLLLTMLAERVVDIIRDVTMLQINTDGFSILMPKSEYKKYIQLCTSWEKLTNLELEYVNYDKMFIRDVNSYISLYEDGTLKQKGAFEIKRDWHKNHSMMAIRKAAVNYLVYNTPIEETFDKCDIFDFFKAFTTTKGWVTKLHTINGIVSLQKTNRYLITNSQNTIYKHHIDGRINAIESGYSVSIINDYDPSINYKTKLNMTYYKNECLKLIDSVDKKQLTLDL